MRRRVRSRALMSVRTATRNFDLELAIATLRLHTQLYVDRNDSGSVWRQQGGPFLWFCQVEGRSGAPQRACSLKGPRARRNECHRRDLVGTIGKPFPPPVAIL